MPNTKLTFTQHTIPSFGMPFVDITFGTGNSVLRFPGVPLSGGPRAFKSLTHARLAEHAGEMHLSLLDLDGTLESQIIALKDNITVQYGFVNGPKSPLFAVTPFDYIPTFTGSAMEIDLKLFDKGVLNPSGNPNVSNNPMLQDKTREWSLARVSQIFSSASSAWRARNPVVGSLDQSTQLEISDIVLAIAIEHGWNVTDDNGNLTIEQTETQPESTYTSDGSKQFVLAQTNQTDYNFIMNVLTHIAMSAPRKIGGYRFFFTKGNVVHFHPVSYTPPIKLYKLRGFGGTIIKWSPDLPNAIALTSGAGTVTVAGYDKDSGTEVHESIDTITAADQGVELADVGGNRTISPVASSSHYQKPFATEARAKQYLKSFWTYMHQQFYNATMDILGDPALNPLDNIAVEISTPGGKLHYSSGWWTVQNVTHTISSTGSFTSRVTLFRPAHGADGPGQVSPSTTKSLTDVSNAQVEE